MKKATKPAEAATHTTSNNSDVFVGADRQVSWFSRHKKRLIVWGTVVVLLLVAVAVIDNLTKPAPPPVKVYTADLPKDYALMTEEQVARRYQADTGESIKTISEGSITGSRLNSFDKAYAAAQALRTLRQYDKSVKAYGIAESKAGANQADYRFYLQYIAAADSVKDDDLANSLVAKAKLAIQNDTTLSAATRKSLTEDLDKRSHLKELGY